MSAAICASSAASNGPPAPPLNPKARLATSGSGWPATAWRAGTIASFCPAALLECEIPESCAICASSAASNAPGVPCPTETHTAAATSGDPSQPNRLMTEEGASRRWTYLDRSRHPGRGTAAGVGNIGGHWSSRRSCGRILLCALRNHLFQHRHGHGSPKHILSGVVPTFKIRRFLWPDQDGSAQNVAMGKGACASWVFGTCGLVMSLNPATSDAVSGIFGKLSTVFFGT